MKNLLILATSALCVLLAVAVPLPAETDQNVQLVQIPLEGNKVCFFKNVFMALVPARSCECDLLFSHKIYITPFRSLLQSRNWHEKLPFSISRNYS